ncbi:hypothetical protein AB0D08_14190, partial [Kitasatospora sp. NPDC048540]
LTETPALLRSNNRLASSSAQVRLRAVLAAGEVAVQELGGALGGVVGRDLNQAFRLLNSDQLRHLLTQSGEQLLLCVSDPVYQGIVSHGHHGVPATEFHQVSVLGKEGPLTGWVHGSAGPAAAGPPVEPQRPALGGPATSGGVQFIGGSPSFGGSLVTGDQHIVSGGQVHGDISVGDSRRGGTK